MIEAMMVLSLFGVADGAQAPFVLYVSAIGAFIVSLTTGGAFAWQIVKDRKSNKREDAQQELNVRSVTFEEMEAAIPGLGSLVDRWQSQAESAFKEIEKLRKSETADRTRIFEQDQRIAELELKVKVLTADLIAEKSKNIKLEERIQQLEGKA